MVQLGLLSLACMLSWITLSRGQNDPQALFPEECCTKMTVGDVAYTQVAGNTEGFDCTGQCVYEEDGKPGSRTCFKSGGPGPLPTECTESFIDSAFVSFARNSGNIIFNTAIGTYSCTVGSAPTDGEIIECSKQKAAEATLETEKAAFFSSKSSDGKLEWMCFHTADAGIHCDFDEALKCRYVPPYQQESHTLYVECGIKINSSNTNTEIEMCQELCNNKTNAECMFWTLSSKQAISTEDTHGNRIHVGESECGIRNYTASVLLNNINKNQYTGLWMQPESNQGSVYVLDQYTTKTADECRFHCENITGCTVWTWQRNPDGYGSVCALNLYTPVRKVIIPWVVGQPQLISGCIGFNCTDLPYNC